VQSATSAAVGEITQSRARGGKTAVKHIAELIDAVRRIELSLGSVGTALAQVAKVSGSIEAIARQNQPACTECDHRGRPRARPPREEALRSSASEVKKPRRSDAAGDPSDRRKPFAILDGSGRPSDRRERRRLASGPKNAGEGAQQIQSIIVRVQDGFYIGRPGGSTGVAQSGGRPNLAHCDLVIDELGNLAKGVDSVIDRAEARR